MANSSAKHYCIAITGASGFVYAQRLLELLIAHDCVLHVLMSDAAFEVARLEHDVTLGRDADSLAAYFSKNIDASERKAQLHFWQKSDWVSPVASGSHPLEAMVVCPCSTGTLAAIASGLSNNLIERAATVCLKESRRLVLLTREMPLSAIQLEHMHKLAQMGVRVLPASPGFYHHPKSLQDMIDFVVARVLQQMGLDQQLIGAWGAE